jgi:hypothetical protein
MTMPEAGSGMYAGVGNYMQGKQRQRQNVLNEQQEARAQRGEERDIAKEEREVDADTRAKRVETMKQWLGPASTANTPDKWLSAQEAGFLPKELKFEQREPFIMATMTEGERLAREKEMTRASESDRTFGETVRHHKATEDRKEAKGGKGGGGRGGMKATDERLISSEVAGMFDGTYDIATGRVQIKDDRNRRLARKIIGRASQIAAGNPDMPLQRIVNQAAEENGISISDVDKKAAPTVDEDPFGWQK